VNRRLNHSQEIEDTPGLQGRLDHARHELGRLDASDQGEPVMVQKRSAVLQACWVRPSNNRAHGPAAGIR
jgi:hypothetical protein